MIKWILPVFLISVSTLFSGNIDDKVLAEVGKEKVSYKQLQRAYSKNLNREAQELKNLTKDSIMNFIELYVNYRLKVLDAIDKGYLQDSAVKAEFKSNRKILAESFFYEKKLMKPKIEQILNRRDWDLKFAYIIIPKSQTDTNSNVSAAVRAQEALSKVKAGEDFGEIAKLYTADPQTKETGGVVDSYITGGKIQRPLENALYSLEAGEVYPNVLETNYGYFILKLIEKERRELVYASHILLGSVTGWNEEDSIRYNKTADSLITLINNGADFSKLAMANSNDESTSSNGGSFGEYYSRSSGFEKSGSPVLKNFEKAMFSLEDGEISGKVWTDFGVHIIKRDSTKIIDREEEAKEVKKLYKRIYYNDDKEYFIDSIAKANGFVVFDNILNDFQSSVDTNKTTLGADWDENVTDDLKSLRLFAFNKNFITVGEFITATEKQAKLRGTPLNKAGIIKACRSMIEDELFELATADLDKEFPDFATLLQEFQDGIILFKAENEEVWQKRTFDSTLAKEYWESTKSDYKTNHQIDFSEIFVLTRKEAESIRKALDNGASFDSLATLKTQRSGYREKEGRYGLVDVKRNRIAKYIDLEKAKNDAILGPVETERGYAIFKIHEVIKPRVKTFDEAYSEIAPRVQDMMQQKLRKEWLDRVRLKHKVVIKEDAVNDIIKK